MDFKQLEEECLWYWAFDGSMSTGPPRNVKGFALFPTEIALAFKKRRGSHSGGLWGTRKAWWVYGARPIDDGVAVSNDIYFNHRDVEPFESAIFDQHIKPLLKYTFGERDVFSTNKYLKKVFTHYSSMGTFTDPPVILQDQGVCCFYCTESVHAVMGDGFERGKIFMPKLHLWTEVADFYQTFFHELMHWYIDKNNHFLLPGDDELVCEVGASRIMSELVLPLSTNIKHYQYYSDFWKKHGSYSSENFRLADEWAGNLLQF